MEIRINVNDVQTLTSKHANIFLPGSRIEAALILDDY